jgi:hypothetical protein
MKQVQICDCDGDPFFFPPSSRLLVVWVLGSFLSTFPWGILNLPLADTPSRVLETPAVLVNNQPSTAFDLHHLDRHITIMMPPVDVIFFSSNMDTG